MREYDFNNEANFGLECHRCGKEIKRLPCKMVPVNDLEDWVYFHINCFKRFKHEQKHCPYKLVQSKEKI